MKTDSPSPIEHESHPTASAEAPWSEKLWAALAFIAALGLLVTEHWLAARSYQHLRNVSWIAAREEAVFALASLVLTCASAWLLSRMHHHEPRPRGLRQVGPQLFVLLFLLLAGQWSALAGEHWFSHGRFHLDAHPARFVLLAFAGLVIFGVVATRLRERLLHPRNLAPLPLQKLPAARHPRALIVFVSTPTHVPELAGASPTSTFHARLTSRPGKDGSTVHCDLLGQSLETDIDVITPFQKQTGENWNWQNLLRVLQDHQRLESIWLVGSSDAKSFTPSEEYLKPGHRCDTRNGQGSEVYLQIFARPLLQRYTPAAVHVRAGAVDFEDFDALVTVLRELLTGPLRAVPSGEIFVDVTGGQKTTSIAGATLTLNRELRFQYVQTNAPHDTLTYDLILHGPPDPHGHS